MKQKLIMLLIVLIALLPFWGAHAGKPTPAYPEPEVQTEAYPLPEPTPTRPPFELPQGQTGASGYIWGLFPDENGTMRWWASKPGIWFGSDVSMCVISRIYVVLCFDMSVYQYDGAATWYHSGPFRSCGWWSVQNGWWDGEIMEIRQPNDFKILCNHFPGIRRG